MKPYIFVFLLFIGIPLVGMASQPSLASLSKLLAIFTKEQTDGSQKAAPETIKSLKLERKAAKQKNDAQATQDLTERIIDLQVPFFQRYYIATAISALVVSFVAGYKFGVYNEQRRLPWEIN